MKERLFIDKARNKQLLEEFLKKQFTDANCGDIEVQYTPVGTKIVIHTTTPGLVIGRGGEKIKEISDILKDKFKIDNPQIDVQKIENPNLNPKVLAKSIAEGIEKNMNYKRLGGIYTKKIMDAGAIGCEIVFSGKFRGQRGFKERFIEGYLKKCGDPSVKDVLKGFAVANPKLGNVGISVKIMIRFPERAVNLETLEEKKETPKKSAKKKTKIVLKQKSAKKGKVVSK
jgi:small subunit ribosomal protein S3